MLCRSFAFVAFLSAIASASARKISPTAFTGRPVVSGYWPSYSSSLLEPDDIPYNKLTHVEWFVASTTASYALDLGKNGDENLKAVVKKAHEHHVTVSMSIGGWDGSIYFSDLVANATGRSEFVKSIKGYVDQYGVDGIDIDWEYPGVQGVGCNKISTENDADNYLEFLKELRSAVGSNKRLSGSVSISGIKGPDGNIYNRTSELAEYLDYVTLMAYDIYGSWSGTTGPLGPLYSTCATPEGQGASGADALKTWTDAGFPANRLILGVPSYSRPLVTLSSTLNRTTVGNYSSLFYQTFNASNLATGGIISAPAGTDVCGNATAEAPEWLFHELISTGKLTADAKMGSGQWKRYFDDCSQTPFLFNNVTREFIPYDDPQSFDMKAAFVRANGMAGINVFDLSGDTSDSMLMTAVGKRLLGPGQA